MASGAGAGRQPQPCPSDTSTNWACWWGGGQLGQVPVALSSPPHASALGKPTPMGLRSPLEEMGWFLHCPMTDIEQCSAHSLYILGESYTWLQLKTCGESLALLCPCPGWLLQQGDLQREGDLPLPDVSFTFIPCGRATAGAGGAQVHPRVVWSQVYRLHPVQAKLFLGEHSCAGFDTTFVRARTKCKLEVGCVWCGSS